MASEKHYVSYSILFLVIAGLAIVGYVWWETRVERYPGLSEVVDSYYGYEQANNWLKTHSMRVPVYQESVPLSGYISSMEKGAKGWELLNYEIVAAIPEDNRVKLYMKFTEIAPISHLPKEVAKLLKTNESEYTVESEDISIWEKINGKWFAWETGVRSHLYMNIGLVAPNKRLWRQPPE